MAVFDRSGIALRIRSLIAGQGNDLAKTAARLHVEELSLRMSIDELSPHPTMEVLAAVIREYGVDPAWLLTGRYDSAAHRAAMDGEGVTSVLRQFMASRGSPISDLPPERNRLNEQN